jgi:hypothetical protein
VDERMRERMIAALEKAFCEAGSESYEDGIKVATKLTNWLSNGLRSIQTIEQLRQTLDSCEPISKAEEKLALFALEHMPSLVRVGLKLAAKKAAATLPPPPSGRPSALDASGKEAVLDYIAELIRKGASMEAAKLRAAQKFNCSKRTVQRLWTNRESIAEDKPTMDAVVARLSKLE